MIGDVVQYKGIKYCKTFGHNGNCNCAFHKEEFDWCFDVPEHIIGDCVKGGYVFVKLDDLGLENNSTIAKKKLYI